MERTDPAKAEASGAESTEDKAQSSSFRAWFGRAATKVSVATGSAWAFTAALLVILVWIVTGPIFGFSDTWQLVINTGTSVVTFLMVFLIQSTQSRESKATQLKLDELIRAVGDARNEFIDAENDPEDQLERQKREIAAEKRRASQPSGNGEPAQHH